jgi:hypothetical protein
VIHSSPRKQLSFDVLQAGQLDFCLLCCVLRVSHAEATIRVCWVSHASTSETPAMVLKTRFLPQDYNIFSMWITKVEDQWGSYKSSVIFNSNKMSTQAIVCAMIFPVSALQHVKGLQRGSKQIILSFSLCILCKQPGRLVELGAGSSVAPSSWSLKLGAVALLPACGVRSYCATGLGFRV